MTASIERVDLQNRAGDGGRELPSEEFGPNLVKIGHIDPHNRLSRTLERVDGTILFGIWRQRNSRSMSIPAMAAGPIPKLDSAENRPPMVGSPASTRRKRSRAATCSNLGP